MNKWQIIFIMLHTFTCELCAWEHFQQQKKKLMVQLRKKVIALYIKTRPSVVKRCNLNKTVMNSFMDS